MILREFHDLLLEQKPESADHDQASCPFCNEDGEHEHDNQTEDSNDYSVGGGDMKTYTEDEFTAAVTEAVTPLQAAADAKVAELQAEIDELRTSQARSEVEGQIAELQADLDKAEIRVVEAERKYDDLVAYLEETASAAEAAALVELRRSERRDAVQAAAPFSDEYIDANLDRWVAMEDEAFEAVVEDWKTVSSSVHKDDVVDEAAEVPAETAMSIVRNEDHGGSVAASVFAARGHGVDVRYL
jgi:hypothetical protein